MEGKKMAAVFGGGMKSPETKEYRETILIGNMLSKYGYDVKSGGYYGIMEAISIGVSESGGKSIGYTCKKFKSTKGNKFLSETIITDDIFERLRLLIENTDIFIVQRGSVGTLSELFLSLDVIRKMKDKPRIILVGSFWGDIFGEMSILIGKDDIDTLSIVDDYKEIERYLIN